MRPLIWWSAAKASAYNSLSFAAAASIRAMCNAEKPPDVVAQSCPGLALQKGHTKLRGEVGRGTGTPNGILPWPSLPLAIDGFFMRVLE